MRGAVPLVGCLSTKGTALFCCLLTIITAFDKVITFMVHFITVLDRFITAMNHLITVLNVFITKRYNL